MTSLIQMRLLSPALSSAPSGGEGVDARHLTLVLQSCAPQFFVVSVTSC